MDIRQFCPLACILMNIMFTLLCSSESRGTLVSSCKNEENIMGNPKQKDVIWTRGINHSDYFWLINMGLHFTLPTSLLAYIMTCSGCVFFNLTIYCHVKRCLGTIWSPLTVFMRMSIVLPI